MKLDMHCHVREGSVDSRVSLDEYITTLKEKGFDGMLPGSTLHSSTRYFTRWVMTVVLPDPGPASTIIGPCR